MTAATYRLAAEIPFLREFHGLPPKPSLPSSHNNTGSSMGSVSSLLGTADSGYRGGSDSFNSGGTTVEEEEHVYEDLDMHIIPPRITPVSGKLEKSKNRRVVKPIAVRPITPSTGSSNPPTPVTPATPDGLRYLPPPFSPDSVRSPPGRSASAASGHTHGTTPPPAKTSTLPHHHHHHYKYAIAPHKRASIAGEYQIIERKLTNGAGAPCSSLGHLSGSTHSVQQTYSRVADYRHRHMSSAQPNSDPRSAGHRRASQSSTGSSSNYVDYKVISVYEDASPSSALDKNRETSYQLKKKIQEQESQIALLRQTMEKNEQIIFKVYQEKQVAWEQEMDSLRHQLKGEQDKDHRYYQTSQQHQQQIYQLEMEKKRLRQEVDRLGQDNEIMRQQLQEQSSQMASISSQAEESKWQVCQKSGEISLLKTQLKDSKGEVEARMNEIMVLRTQFKESSAEVVEKDKEIAALLREVAALRSEAQGGERRDSGATDRTSSSTLERQAKRREGPGSTTMPTAKVENLQRLLSHKDNELSQENLKVIHLQEEKGHWAEIIREQEQDLGAAREALGQSQAQLLQQGQQLAQAQQAQQALRQQLLDKEHQLVHLRPPTHGGGLPNGLGGSEKELAALEGRLVQSEKEVAKLHSKLARINNNASPDCSSAGSSHSGSTSGRGLFNGHSSSSTEELERLQEQLRQQERDNLMWHEKLVQRESEVTSLKAKLGGREDELTLLKRKLGQLEQENNQGGRGQKSAGEDQQELVALRGQKASLENEVKRLHSRNSSLQEKVDRVGREVGSLKRRGSDQSPSGSGDPVTQGSAEGLLKKLVDELQGELDQGRAKLMQLEQDYHSQQEKWHDEKEQVLRYQQHLNLNYKQICRKNSTLEKEIQQLTVELESKDLQMV